MFLHIVLLCCFTLTSSLTCWRCAVVGGEKECIFQGVSEECHDNQACITEFREENHQSTLIQSCKQKLACSQLLLQNKISCNRNRPGLPISVCYGCCQDNDYCNSKAIVRSQNTGSKRKQKTSASPDTTQAYRSSRDQATSLARDEIETTKSTQTFFEPNIKSTLPNNKDRLGSFTTDQSLGTSIIQKRPEASEDINDELTTDKTEETRYTGTLLMLVPDEEMTVNQKSDGH